MPRCISTRTHVDITYRRVFASFSSYNAIIPLHSVLSSIFRPQVRIGRLLLQSRSQKERWGPSFFVGPGTCIGPVWTVPRQKEGERGERGQDEDANCFSRTKLGCIALLDGASRFFGDSERVARKRFDEFSAKSTSNRVNSRGNIRTLKKNLVPNNFLGAKN